MSAVTTQTKYLEMLKKWTWRKASVVLAVVVVIAAAIFFGIRYDQIQNRNNLLSNPTTAGNLEVSETVQAVGKLISLPAKETPTLATVTNVTQLKSQTFFANAKNGDKVLIYTQAKVAILYRPSINKIIQIGPVNIGSTAGQ
jgi:predicted negative regulator of RcsB-dependent stress response